MSWSADYNPDNIINDYTKPLSKVWDNLMPLSYPHVLEFKTNKVFEVLVKRKMGPYPMNENFIDYDCDVIIDKTPLVENGWDGGPINKEMVDKCYGELYFNNLRAKMVELAQYAGLKFSTFDAGGTLNAKTNG
jgi:hypothetical protein